MKIASYRGKSYRIQSIEDLRAEGIDGPVCKRCPLSEENQGGCINRNGEDCDEVIGDDNVIIGEAVSLIKW